MLENNSLNRISYSEKVTKTSQKKINTEVEDNNNIIKEKKTYKPKEISHSQFAEQEDLEALNDFKISDSKLESTKLLVTEVKKEEAPKIEVKVELSDDQVNKAYKELSKIVLPKGQDKKETEQLNKILKSFDNKSIDFSNSSKVKESTNKLKNNLSNLISFVEKTSSESLKTYALSKINDLTQNFGDINELLVNTEKNRVTEIVDKLKNKEPREQLNDLAKLKLETNEGKDLLKEQINQLTKKHLGKFSNGLDEGNIKTFVSTVKQVTEHKGVFNSNRLIQTLYKELEKAEKVYTNPNKNENGYIHLQDQKKALTKVAQEAQSFIDKNSTSTRVDWVKEVLKQVNSEIGNLNTKIENSPEVDKVRANLKKVETKDYSKNLIENAKKDFLVEKQQDKQIFKDTKIKAKDLVRPFYLNEHTRLKNITQEIKKLIEETQLNPKDDINAYKKDINNRFIELVKKNDDSDLSFSLSITDFSQMKTAVLKATSDLKIPHNDKKDLIEKLSFSFYENKNIVDSGDFNKPENIDLKGKNYLKGKVLGEGAFGKAVLMTSNDGENIVAKFQSQNRNNAIEKEAAILKYVLKEDGTSHKNVLAFKGVVNDPVTDFPVILTEEANGGELTDIMKKLEVGKYEENGKTLTLSHEEKVMIEVYLLRNVMEGMKFLQEEKNLKHLDLKPANIFFDKKDMLPKIADFGLSSVGLQEEQGIKGTPVYLAPEVMLDSKISSKADNWSLGSIIHEMILNKSPEYTEKPAYELVDIAQNAMETKFQKAFDKDGNVEDTTALGRVVNALMEKDPNKRPTISAVLNSTFFKDSEQNDAKVKELLGKLLK